MAPGRNGAAGQIALSQLANRDGATRMKLLHRIKNWSNPHDLTHIHLKRMAAHYGFTIGDHTYGNPNVRFPDTGARLSIGRYGSIADKVEIMLGGNHHTDLISTYPFGALPDLWPEARSHSYKDSSNGDVMIGHDVWIGTGAIILSGITIGHGAVIAARAVITKDVPPYAIVGGNPAKIIRYRFDDMTISRLLASQWWDLPHARIIALVPLLQSKDIDGFLKAVDAG
jgi:acetyltransferase-like isoleucine patch superfamily enzyme